MALLGLTVLAGAGAGMFLAPRPAALGSATTGDTALAAQVREAAGDGRGYRGLSVAVISRDGIRLAGLGDSGDRERTAVDESTVFEAGSLGKAMTGMLLSELAARHTLRLDVPLERLLPDEPFSDPTLGEATLMDLATHRAGVDLMPSSLDVLLRGAELRTLGMDPYRGITPDDVVTAGRQASSSGTGRFRYSNLGMALAGQTAARVTGKPYEELLRQHLLVPLGMSHTQTVRSESEIPPNSAVGHRANGAGMQHWLASGYTPAGDLWSTSGDLAGLMRAVMLGTAPGSGAATPQFDAGAVGRIGLGWYTTRLQGRDITWHDGETGGFTSYMGFDRSSGKGVVVLSNTDQPVDAIGQHLLGLMPERSYPTHDATPILLTVLCCAGAACPVFYVARRRFPRRVHRVHSVLSVAFGVALLGLARRIGDWVSVPPWLWAVGGVLLAVGCWWAVLRLPPADGARKDPPPLKAALLGARYAAGLLSLFLLVIAAELS
ncbi:hypothetical protein GCM10010324_37830 [Streptomyces hiroshimensis]|uniref:Beta-lactamase-related domain-containing protein n=2 Tax=Streptomyces hiroshimensis TaxID=66424 RepID=A0ABQ2YNE5_9ACTN|nr:hypothetical protein GCM10010324_37830 [Streptomyces hiroshimensis]